MPNPVLTRLVEEREQLNESIDQVLSAANDEERDPSEAERDLLKRYRSELEKKEEQISGLADLEETREKARDVGKLVRRQEPPAPEDPPEDEPPEGEWQTFAQYARDVMITRFDRVGATVDRGLRQRAAQRLQRAPANVLVADVGPYVSPTYISQIMQVIDRSRPLVSASNQVGLSSGQVQWPRITNQPDVGEQLTEKTEAGVGTMTVVMQSTVAKTYLVAANFSWQTVQWSNPDAMQLWFDLAGVSYAKQTDAAAGAVLAAADAAPTVITTPLDLAKLMAAISTAAAEVYTNTGRFATTIAANPADAYEIVSLVGNVTPTFLPVGAADLSTGTFPPIAGLRFIVSAAIPAKSVIVGDFSALLSAETPGSPVELRAVEPSIGGIEVGIIGAFASAITDTGAFAEITLP
jgi:HK97 family phage major capsid protein